MLDAHQRVADIVLEHSECAEVLQRYGIDFCCRGERTLAAACAEEGLGAGTVLDALTRAVAERAGRGEPDPRALSTAALIAHVISRHHGYLRQALPFVEWLADKVARVHAERDARLPALARIVHELAAALGPHLDHEEQVLFPALMAGTAERGLVVRELEAMRAEHTTVGALLTWMREQARDYRVPDWACGSLRTLLVELERLEADTLRHVHLENHVLAARFGHQGTP